MLEIDTWPKQMEPAITAFFFGLLQPLHMELAKLMNAVKLWDEAQELLERDIGRLQAQQMTASTVRKIE